jgi:hypothetical protein
VKHDCHISFTKTLSSILQLLQTVIGSGNAMLITMMDSVQQQEDEIMVQVTFHWWVLPLGCSKILNEDLL